MSEYPIDLVCTGCGEAIKVTERDAREVLFVTSSPFQPFRVVEQKYDWEREGDGLFCPACAEDLKDEN